MPEWLRIPIFVACLSTPSFARMAEQVDALVSKTNERKLVPVQFRLRVQSQIRSVRCEARNNLHITLFVLDFTLIIYTSPKIFHFTTIIFLPFS